MHSTKLPIIIFCPRDIAGGSHNYWLNLLEEQAFIRQTEISVIAEESPSTVAVATQKLRNLNIRLNTYRPDFDPTFAQRLLRRVCHSRCKRQVAIEKELKYRGKACVWFLLDGFYSLYGCFTAIESCFARGIPVHLIFQHVDELVAFDCQLVFDRVVAALKNAKRLVFVSKRNLAVVEAAITARLANAQLGTNGLSLKRFDLLRTQGSQHVPGSRASTKLLNLARFSIRYKGQNLLLDALRSPLWTQRKWHLLLAGGGEDEWYLKRLLDFYGFDDSRVSLSARDPRPESLLENCDLFTLPSYSEGMAFALVEAAAMARPLLATDVAGAGELVVDGETGFLAKAATVTCLSETLENAWGSRNRWKVMGEQAQALARANHCLADKLESVLRDNWSDLDQA